MKALCVCNGGHVRSVTLARLLRKRGMEALVCGVNKGFSDKTIWMLFDWAEVIYIQRDSLAKLEARFKADGVLMLDRWREKMSTAYDVGPDDWKMPQHPDLLRIMREKVENGAALRTRLLEQYSSVEEYQASRPQ